MLSRRFYLHLSGERLRLHSWAALLLHGPGISAMANLSCDKLLANSSRVYPSMGRRFNAQMALRMLERPPEPDAPSEPPKSEPAKPRKLPPAGAPPARLARPLRAIVPRPIFIGDEMRRGRRTSFEWALAEQQNAFLLTLGSSGSGKTELLRVVGRELGAQSAPIIAIDFHADLKIAGLPRVQLGEQLGLNPLELGPGTRNASIIAEMLQSAAPGLGHVQASLLRRALRTVLAEDGSAQLGELQSRLEEVQGSERASARGLLDALQLLFDAPVFQAKAYLPISEIVRNGASLDLSGLAKPARKVAAGVILAQIFELLTALGPLQQPGALRCFVLLDEASALRESELIAMLAKEARKFGLGLAVATQEANDVAESLRANAASVAVFRALNHSEGDRASKLFQSVTAEQLQRLHAPGECYFRDSGGVHLVRVVPAAERQPAEARDDIDVRGGRGEDD